MDEERLSRLEQRLDELDQRSSSMERAMDRAMDRSRAAMDTMVPAETRRHIRAAWRENLLADPDTSSVRLVLNLERVSIQEAQRSFTYFHLYGFPTDLIVANRVLPAASGVYFELWREAQARYLPMVEEQFAPVPVRTVPFFDHEMVGINRLVELGRALFGDADPSAFLYRGRPYSVKREDGGYTLSVELPFASKEEISLSRSSDELLLQVGAWRRNLVLPRLLLDTPAQGAKMEDRVLKVRFAEPRGISGGSRHGSR